MPDAPQPKKSLGQHWLNDRAALEAIANAASIEKLDVVLEIGPGLGSLTEVLVKRAASVTAVEFDQSLAQKLPIRVRADNLTIISQDILAFDFATLPPDYKIVANIPYYLTSNLIRVISETSNQPKRAVLLIQKEVAERVATEPGAMSILSVTAQYFWDVSLGLEVPAELFTPPPKVDSQVLVLSRRDEPLFAGVDTTKFFHIVKAGFSQRRKTLLNSLSAGLRLSKAEVTSMCEQAAIDPGRRAQTLSLAEWHKLYVAINP